MIERAPSMAMFRTHPLESTLACGDLRRRGDRSLHRLLLAQRRIEVIVVERTGVACAASGKSGGFLALDWCDGTPSAASPGAASPCTRNSPPGSTAAAGAIAGSTLERAGERRGVHAGRAVSGPAWIGENALVQGKLGTQATTAQVHPARFTEAAMQAAIGMGARLRLGCVTGVVLDAGRTTAEGSRSTARCSTPTSW